MVPRGSIFFTRISSLHIWENMDFNSEPLREPDTGKFSNSLEPTSSSGSMGIHKTL